MKNIVLTIASVGLIGIAATGPALAGPTPEQAAQEWTEVVPSTSTTQTTTDSIAESGNPSNAVNGMAQRRIFNQQEQSIEH